MELRPDDGDLLVDRVEDAVPKIGVVVEHDPQHGDEDEQQREQRDEPVVGEQRAVLPPAILPVAQEDGHDERRHATALLPAIRPLESRPDPRGP